MEDACSFLQNKYFICVILLLSHVRSPQIEALIFNIGVCSYVLQDGN